MNKVNYDKEFEKTVHVLGDKTPKLLMHACCAPCSTACIDRVKEYFDLTVFFYNPNIDGEVEYEKRKNELIKYCDKIGIKYIISDYISSEFYTAVKGKEEEKEGGTRCEICYRLRLIKTAETAVKNGFEYFTTTLTVSPLKSAEKINVIGKEIEKELKVKFLPSDFKKNGGYLKSVEISKRENMYRQNYCGCEFSKNRNSDKN